MAGANKDAEKCAICGCSIHRTRDTYADATREGISHSTAHHHVAQRFFKKRRDKKGKELEPIFTDFPGANKDDRVILCYECHEELLHNPVFLKEDIDLFRELVNRWELNESDKPDNRTQIAGRIELLHEVINTGLTHLLAQEQEEEKYTPD